MLSPETPRGRDSALSTQDFFFALPSLPYHVLVSPSGVVEVYPARFSFQDPWRIPPSATRLALLRSTDGGPPRLRTEAAIYYDPDALFVTFTGDDQEVVATYREHDQPLYEEDAVEVFLAPRTLTEYFELEVSPLGTTFDARVVSPEGNRATLRMDLKWECAGFWAASFREFLDVPRSRFSVVLSIPFASLGLTAPKAGEVWRANLFRIDRSARGDEYTAWQPTLLTPPDFHVPASFGELRFRA